MDFPGGYISRKLILVDSSCNYERRITSVFLQKHLNAINDTFGWLEDDLSRWTMVACFNGYISLMDFAMEFVRSYSDQYFEEGIVSACEGEVFVDCGAFIGDSVIPFVELCNSQNVSYKSIFAFEPDKDAFAKLRKLVNNYHDLNIIPMGVGDFCGDAYITSSFGASRLSKEGQGESVRITTIDEYLKHENVSFIKMDLEGGEMAALRGAKNTIAKLHPKLAICIYHKPEDWITIPSFIRSLNPNYKLYCRGYFNNLSEIVLYCI